MNKIETNKILKRIIFAYPKTYEKYFSDNSFFKYDDLIELWQEQFENDTYYLVNLAINDIIKTNKFAPTIADIKVEIEKIKSCAIAKLNQHKMATQGIEGFNFNGLSQNFEKIKITSGEPLSEKELEEVKKILGD